MTKRSQNRVSGVAIHKKIHTKFLAYNFLRKSQPSMSCKNKDILLILARQSASRSPNFYNLTI